MATARSICTDALIELGVLAANEVMDAPTSELVLRRFQYQLDTWNADGDTLNLFPRITATILSGTTQLTIGQSGTPDINTPRPVFIKAINYINPGSSPAVEVPMGQMDQDAYANLSIKQLSNTLPTLWFYDQTVPNGTLIFWPQVSQNVQIVIYVQRGTTSPATLDDEVSGPPAYIEAFIYQLAERLSGKAFGQPLTPELQLKSHNAYLRMKAPNIEPGLLGVDQALVPSQSSAYNVLSDQGSAPSSR
jgi:hypothetical protein